MGLTESSGHNQALNRHYLGVHCADSGHMRVGVGTAIPAVQLLRLDCERRGDSMVACPCMCMKANQPLQATPGLAFLFSIAQRPGAPELRCWAAAYGRISNTTKH
jgi:hypothetical protein